MNFTFLIISLLFLFTFKAFPYFPKGTLLVEPPKDPQSLDDFAHPNKGCPENSECDEVMGKRILQFKALIKELEAEEDWKLRVKKLEAFRAQFGLPADFYTQERAGKSFGPLFYNSPCRNHNPKNKSSQILVGTAFLKGISSRSGQIQRGSTLFEIPHSELFSPQPVEVFFSSDKPVTFYLPVNERPLFIKEKSLIVLREEDSFFYAMKISDKGEWQIAEVDLSEVSKWSERNTQGPCPTSPETAPEAFGTHYCEHIWSEDEKKNIPVKYYRGCVL
jgi:hypothetical protein